MFNRRKRGEKEREEEHERFSKDVYGVFKEEEKWRTQKKHFRYDEADKAAEFITKWLNYDKVCE